MSRSIPTINTQRLLLRPLRTEDFPRYAEIWAKPEVVRYISAQPLAKAQAWDRFLRNAGHWQVVGFGNWGVHVHGSAQIAGQVGFQFGSRDLGEDFDPHPEAGWVMHPEAQGQGLGLEAARAAHDWYDRVIAGRTVCMIAQDHTRSLDVAAALGYVPLRQVTLEGEQVQLMTRKGPPV